MRVAVPRAVEHLQDKFAGPIENLADAAALYLADAYKFYIVDVGAVDSTDLLRSVHVELGTGMMDLHSRYVVADVKYAAVVEFGWTDRGKGQASYPGRHPAGLAVEYFMQQLYSGQLLHILNIRELDKK